MPLRPTPLHNLRQGAASPLPTHSPQKSHFSYTSAPQTSEFSSLLRKVTLSKNCVCVPHCRNLTADGETARTCAVHGCGQTFSNILKSTQDCLVRSRRLELPRALAHNDLNVARLPVPPRPHTVSRANTALLGRSGPVAKGLPLRKRRLQEVSLPMN